jgi:uncharacterized protein (DUF433 family)
MKTHLIVDHPDIQSGAPVFGGTRVPVQNLFDYIEEGDSLDVFLAQFPSVTRAMAVSVLEQARAALVQDACSA